MAYQPGNALTGLVAVDVSNKQQKLFYTTDNGILTHPVWLPHGEGLLVLIRDQTSNFRNHQIGLISYPQGKLRPLTRDTNNYADLSIAADGHTLATVQSEKHWDLFLSATNGNGEPQQITSGAPVQNDFSWTPDNKILIDQDFVISRLDPTSGSKTVLMSEQGAPLLHLTPAPTVARSYLCWRCTPGRESKIPGSWMHQAGTSDNSAPARLRILPFVLRMDSQFSFATTQTAAPWPECRVRVEKRKEFPNYRAPVPLIFLRMESGRSLPPLNIPATTVHAWR